MRQDDSSVEAHTRARLRELRTARGWTLEHLARESGVSASTISRIETGHRRLGLDQLVPLARALGRSVDELVEPAPDDDDVVIRPEPRRVDGRTAWMLGPARDGRVVFKVRFRGTKSRPAMGGPHPGHDWVYVLSGTLWLVLDGRDLYVPEGRAAEFSTRVPHGFGGAGGPVETLMIFDGQGQRTHADGDDESRPRVAALR
jgi:transcriptional regulator with XRE-family HTH domain